MIQKKLIYWVFQVAGWSAYVTLIGILIGLNPENGGINKVDFYLNLISIFVIGVGLSQLFRFVLIKLGWLELKFLSVIPRAIALAVLFGTAAHFLQSFTSDVLIAKTSYFFEWGDAIQKIINWSVLFTLWSLVYFLVHFITNYRQEEIKNLKWEAAKNEIELNQLKSQLNPHFIFNAMNSIRALISENPNSAKDAVTKLSNILRNSLLLNRKRFISLHDELELVKDYISLEKIRYEDRLTVVYEIDENSLSINVPPLMIQTIVENAIKHGISKLPKGGKLCILSKNDGDALLVEVTNTGNLDSKASSSGFGIENTNHRLEILYGSDASFTLSQKNENTVSAILKIPLTKT